MRKQNAIIISDIKAIRKHVYMHYIVMMYVMHSSPLLSAALLSHLCFCLQSVVNRLIRNPSNCTHGSGNQLSPTSAEKNPNRFF